MSNKIIKNNNDYFLSKIIKKNTNKKNKEKELDKIKDKIKDIDEINKNNNIDEINENNNIDDINENNNIDDINENNNIDDINEFDKNKINKTNSNRIYNSIYRKKLLCKFDNIINKKILNEIYNIIINDIGTNYSHNRNGIFINLNILSDNCIEKINNYINNISDNNYYIYNENNKLDMQNCNIYKLDDIEILSEIGYKLTNQEKNIIKKIGKEK